MSSLTTKKSTSSCQTSQLATSTTSSVSFFYALMVKATGPPLTKRASGRRECEPESFILHSQPGRPSRIHRERYVSSQYLSQHGPACDAEYFKSCGDYCHQFIQHSIAGLVCDGVAYGFWILSESEKLARSGIVGPIRSGIGCSRGLVSLNERNGRWNLQVRDPRYLNYS